SLAACSWASAAAGAAKIGCTATDAASTINMMANLQRFMYSFSSRERLRLNSRGSPQIEAGSRIATTGTFRLTFWCETAPKSMQRRLRSAKTAVFGKSGSWQAAVGNRQSAFGVWRLAFGVRG